MRIFKLIFGGIFILFIQLNCNNVFARHFVVSKNGNNSNTGTLNSPFLTIQYGLSKIILPGDTLFIRGGTYFEALNFMYSGTALFPVVVMPYNAEIVKVDGSNVEQSKGIFIKLDKKDNIIIDGLRFQNFVNRTVPSIGLAVIGGANKIVIRNCKFINFSPLDTLSGELKGIAVISHLDQPVNDIIIEHNQFDSLYTGQSEVITLNGYINNFKVRYNEATRCATNPIFQCAGGYDIQFADGYWTDSFGLPRNGEFTDNYIHDNTGGYGPKAIYVDGGEDMIIERNKIVNNAVGIGVHTEEQRAVHSKRIYIKNNVMYDNFFSISIGNDPNIMPNRLPGVVDSVFIYNNTIVKTYRGLEMERSGISNIFVYNNIFWQEWGQYNDPVIYNLNISIVNFKLDYNLYYTGDEEPVKFKWGAQEFVGISNLTTGKGWELNGQFLNPQFKSFPDDLTLEQSSPAINTGGFDWYGERDYMNKIRPSGGTPDKGAFEYYNVALNSIIPENKINLINIKCYPNPCLDYIMIESEYTILNIELKTLDGKLVNGNFLYNCNTIFYSVLNLNSGYYILNITTNNGIKNLTFVKL
ncbi:MAG: T9SS type A sorting domain-containing protein [Cytophagaceae bacterium]|jgi:hypothetical protein|nr:T9SS type A sorting domain-containing protein [Cytophagaceae bacterium]